MTSRAQNLYPGDLGMRRKEEIDPPQDGTTTLNAQIKFKNIH